MVIPPSCGKRNNCETDSIGIDETNSSRKRLQCSDSTTTATPKNSGSDDVIETLVISNNNNNNSTNRRERDQRAFAVAVATANDVLPTPFNISKMLCHIVDLDRYSRDEIIVTMIKFNLWIDNRNIDFLESFHMHAGICKLLDCIKITMNDDDDDDDDDDSYYIYAVTILCKIIDPFNSTNITIRTNIATSFLEYHGVDTIIEIKTNSHHTMGAWGILNNLTRFIQNKLDREETIKIFDSALNDVTMIKSSGKLQHGFQVYKLMDTLSLLVSKDYITKEYVRQTHSVSKILEPFKRDDGTWRNEHDIDDPFTRSITYVLLITAAINFYSSCFKANLLDNEPDCNILFPFFCHGNEGNFFTQRKLRYVFVAQRNYSIITRQHSRFFDRSLLSSSIRINNDKKKIIKETGLVELLGRIVSKKTDGRQKKKQICLLLGKIAATAM